MGPEICGDAKRIGVDLEFVNEPRQLLDLRRGVELSLVADEVVHPAPPGEVGDDVIPKIEAVGDLAGARLEAKARGEDRVARAIEPRVDQPGAVARTVVVVHLERKGGFAAIHRPGEEDQFRHEAKP